MVKDYDFNHSILILILMNTDIDDFSEFTMSYRSTCRVNNIKKHAVASFFYTWQIIPMRLILMVYKFE